MDSLVLCDYENSRVFSTLSKDGAADTALMSKLLSAGTGYDVSEEELDRADGKTLALRLFLTGKCPIHARLLDRTAQWTEEFKGLAAGFNDLWLEKVKFQTSRKISLKELFCEDTPISGLIQSVDQLEINGDTLFELMPELSALKSKLPAEIYSNHEPFLESNSDNMATLRSEVKELLIAKLLQHGGLG